MPRNPKPLTLLVADELMESEPVQELIRKGHQVDSFSLWKAIHDAPGLFEYDLILAPQAQLMTTAHLKYLPEAIKRARKLKYGGTSDDV